MEKSEVQVDIYFPNGAVTSYVVGEKSEHGVVKSLYSSSNPLAVRVYFEEKDLLFINIPYVTTLK